MGELLDSVARRAESRVGSSIDDKWKLERLIGVGGVAAVYAARHRNGRRVAIKMLHPELGVDASIRRRFLREGYVANRVGHPGAVVVLDDLTHGESVMLVMELLEGETLEARCRRNQGKLDPLESLQIASGLLAILESAHAHDILHRDVTPANIFLTSNGEIKLLDFGIARLRDAETTDHTMSVPGALGTPAFMPPEQARGLWEELDVRSDLWAVGAVLFRATSGEPVHKGRSPSEVLLSAMTKRASALDGVVPGIPPPIAALVDRALAWAPLERWQDARAFRDAVDAAYLELAGHGMSDAPLLSVPELQPISESGTSNTSHADGFGTTLGTPIQRGRRFIVVCSALVAGALGTWLLWPRSSAENPSAPSSSARPASPVNVMPEQGSPVLANSPAVATAPSASVRDGGTDRGRTRNRKPRSSTDPLGEQY